MANSSSNSTSSPGVDNSPNAPVKKRTHSTREQLQQIVSGGLAAAITRSTPTQLNINQSTNLKLIKPTGLAFKSTVKHKTQFQMYHLMSMLKQQRFIKSLILQQIHPSLERHLLYIKDKFPGGTLP